LNSFSMSCSIGRVAFVDHPSDRGGATRFGITEAVARAHGYRGAGPAVAVTFLQRALTDLNRGGADFSDLVSDGALGLRTSARWSEAREREVLKRAKSDWWAGLTG
jgi:lysozyme family protein